MKQDDDFKHLKLNFQLETHNSWRVDFERGVCIGSVWASDQSTNERRCQDSLMDVEVVALFSFIHTCLNLSPIKEKPLPPP